MRVDGPDVTETLYTPAVSELAASLSQRLDVRAFADDLQRGHAARGPAVVEGRDAGTVVFPEAECKFYLDASPGARARRRRGGGPVATRRPGGDPHGNPSAGRRGPDAARRLSRKSADATYVDSSDMTVDEVVELMAKEVEQACSTRS